ncbi:Uncharacterized protein SCF082_LOCUS48533 [Durusdinium trenchii]|uniref:Uncharacterized protein n=2 Tax=Durusdinium trenchii TaxID=1381693 RepID=A0ABP0RX01_9DINO
MAQTGSECILYRNSGTYETPTWDDVPLVRDLELKLEKGEADVTHRGSNGWRQRIGTLKDAGVEFEIVWEPGDADFEAFRDAFLNDTLIDLAVMDGDITVDGQQGLRSEFEVMSFPRSEQLEQGVTSSVNCAKQDDRTVLVQARDLLNAFGADVAKKEFRVDVESIDQAVEAARTGRLQELATEIAELREMVAAGFTEARKELRQALAEERAVQSGRHVPKALVRVQVGALRRLVEPGRSAARTAVKKDAEPTKG